MFERPTYPASEGGPPVLICAEITALMGTLDCELVVTFADLPSTKAGMTILFVLNKHILLLRNHLGLDGLCSKIRLLSYAHMFPTTRNGDKITCETLYKLADTILLQKLVCGITCNCPLSVFQYESTMHNTLHLHVSTHTGGGDDYILPDTFEATFTTGSMLGDTACSDTITIVDDVDLRPP